MSAAQGLRRIGVLRALMLGDMLCAQPLLRALRAHWPDAELVLVGLPWAQEWALRSGAHRFVAFPGWPGLPERTPELGAIPAFLHAMQAERFDLLLQAHGSGRLTNPLVAACAPVASAGFVEDGDWCAEPARYLRWPESGHETARLLALARHLGLPEVSATPALPLRDDERAVARSLVGPGAYACVHVGARFASRRWPGERFAAVADQLAAQGLRIVLTGSAGERALVDAVMARMTQPAVDLCGRTGLWVLGAVVEGARVLVCNDTGVSHVAVAVGTPSVVVSCGADALRWAPADAVRHRVLWHDLPCRPCMHEHCPVGHGCADAVTVDEVVAAALHQAMDHDSAAAVAEGARG